MKTDFGTDRIMPIGLRKQNRNNLKLTYFHYHQTFAHIFKELKLTENHRPHDGRAHFVTACKRYNVDEYTIKYIVGHKISDITEKVYTKCKFERLRQKIEYSTCPRKA